MAQESSNDLAVRLAALLRRTTSHEFRYRVRRTLNRLDNPEVRHARRLVKRVRENPPDVLHFGESTALFVSPDDHDQRRLSQMVTDELVGRADVHTIAGGGYAPDLHDAYLRLIAGSSARPLVLHSLCPRVLQPLIEHPAYGKREELAVVRRLNPAASPWRIRAAVPRPTPSDFERYYRLPHATLLGDLSVGDYVFPLKNGSLRPEERLRILYAYHHGASLTQDTPGLGAVVALGRRLRELGCRTVAYQAPIPIETGAEIFGERFEELIVRNWTVMDAAYREGLGRDATILQTGTSFAPDEFIDPHDGTEHLNERGRQRLARIIAEGVVAELESGQEAEPLAAVATSS